LNRYYEVKSDFVDFLYWK